MMRGIFFLIAIVALPFVTAAQTRRQQAIVKTHGRLQDDGSVVAGSRIPEALIVLKDGAKIFSDSAGELSFSVSASAGYSLTKVSKAGYILSDWDIISRPQKYSATPLDILLESIEEQNAYRRIIERKVRKNYNAQLNALQERIDSLETLADADRREIAKLQADLDKSYDAAEQYVDEMTNRYLNIDFDRAGEFDRKISACILNGELEKADSMLATRGDIVERVRQNKALQQAVAQDMEEVGRDCYRKFEIASQRLQRDSAAYYLELRANLDPHNIDWQQEASAYISEILADYKRALGILEPALEYSRQHYGEHATTANLYNDIGFVNYAQGYYAKAMDHYNKALAIWEKVLELDHPNTATAYSNIGMVYYAQGDYAKALEYCNKALAIREKVLGLDHPDTAMSYNNIGTVYFAQGDYVKPLEYYNMALEIQEKVLGLTHPDTAMSYNNIGVVYSYQGDYTKALDYYTKALDIDEKAFGLEHPATADIYNNIGLVYSAEDDYDKAFEHYNKALVIREKLFGVWHPNTAISYNNIGVVYYAQGDYVKALEYFDKALNIYKKVYGEDDEQTKAIKETVDYLKNKVRE